MRITRLARDRSRPVLRRVVRTGLEARNDHHDNQTQTPTLLHNVWRSEDEGREEHQAAVFIMPCTVDARQIAPHE